MNYSIIRRLLSIILGAVTVAQCICLGISVYFYFQGDSNELRALEGFSASILVSGFISLILFYTSRKGSPKMFHKEALAVIGLGWIVASLLGALPFYLILSDCTPGDAVFESASGFTTTGASVLSNLEEIPKSLLFWRSLSQWIGGLGVVVFFVAILSFLGAGAKILFSSESSAKSTDLHSARVQTGISNLLKLYILLSVVCTVVFHFCGLSWYDALCHMFTTLSTGGFSTRSDSIAAFNNPSLEWFITLFMIFGGTSFVLMLQMGRWEWREVRKNSEFKAYHLILLLATLLTSFSVWSEYGHHSLHDVIRASAFQVVSIMTTTGFSTADFNVWPPFTHILLLVLMIIGGCSGSTGGGIKVVRLVVAMKVAWLQIEHTFRTRVVRSVKVNGRTLNKNAQESILVFLVLMGMVAIGGLILVSFIEPTTSFEGVLSATLACLFNIGPGFAEVGPTHNYLEFQEITKYLLSLLMIMGRLELYAILVLFAPTLWKKFS